MTDHARLLAMTLGVFGLRRTPICR
jgi:hypothetical protein